MNLEQIRIYLNYILPDIIRNKIFTIIDYLANNLWWVFIITTIILGVLLIISYIKIYKLYKERNRINQFLEEISSLEDIKKFEKKLIDFRLFFNAKYIAFYLLRGETYVLQAHNIEAGKKQTGVAGANMYLVKKLVKTKSKSGNFIVSTYVSKKNDFLMQVYAYRFINLKLYKGYIESVFSMYRKLLKTDEFSMKVTISTITKELQSTLSKSLFSGHGYLEYILTLVKNAISAEGIKLYKNNKKLLEIGETNEKFLYKKFYIHNTGYSIEIFLTKKLSTEELKRIGSFLDMTGIFISTFQERDNTAKYYIDFLLRAVDLFESQNEYYYNHSYKVALVSVEIGKVLLYNIEELKILKLGAYLHDIGMIADIKNIINKTTELSKEDLSLIKLHPLIGSILVEPVAHIFPVSPIIKYHHERIDGSGYPFGLAGKEIPQMAQVVAISEFFVGLISDRPYKKGMEIEKAKELIENSGKKIVDDIVLNAFLDIFDSIHQKFLKLELQRKIVNRAVNE